MAEDYTVFWKNNAHAYQLFQSLLERAERGAYNDDFLAQLAAYRETAPESERADIFAAWYLLAHGDAENAARCGVNAFRKRPVNYEVWKILAASYKALGRDMEAIDFIGYAYGLYDALIADIDLKDESFQSYIDRFSLAIGIASGAPILVKRIYTDGDQIGVHADAFAGEPIPSALPSASPPFWSACYADNQFLSDKALLLSTLRRSDIFLFRGHRDFVFDLQKAYTVPHTTHIDVPEGRTCIISVAGTEQAQKISIQTANGSSDAYLGKWAFSSFRLNESVTLQSAEHIPYAVTPPIFLAHAAHRKRLVLNILVDGLSWAAARTRFSSHMPHIAAFFSRGTIFDQNFSTSEYTYPALAAVETGCYPHHIQIFNGNNTHELPLHFQTLSERMKSLGYYCAAPMACGDGIYNGAMRGYDRLITSSWYLPAAAGVERTLQHIEALEETDQFLFLHVADVHPWPAMDFKFSAAVETHLPLSERLFTADDGVASVRLPSLPILQHNYWAQLRRMDRCMGQLLSYIEERYDEDEYIVNLYSDHGVSIFTQGEPDLMGENTTSAAWMIRGAGVPQGMVTDELTSLTDIYRTLGMLCGFPVSPDIDGNLPAAFGGHARDAVYSASMFPGQTYKLAVRNKTHALRLETREVVDEDGTVDFADAMVGIYPRAHELEADCAADSEDLRAFFYPRARAFVRPIANNGEFWPAMRAARPAWFGEKEGQI